MPNLDAALKSYAGEPIRVDRKGRAPERIDHPALTLVLTVQPQVLEAAAAHPQLRGRGLLARFLFAQPRTRLGERLPVGKPVRHAIRAAYQARLRDLLDGAAESAESAKTSPAHANFADLADLAGGSNAPELSMTQDASELLRWFQDDLEPRLHPVTGDLFGVADWVTKLPGKCVRIAANLHLFDKGWSMGTKVPIGDVDMAAGIAIGESLIPHALSALGHTGPRGASMAPAKAILRWIQNERLTEFKASDALRHLSRSTFPDQRTVDQALDALEQFSHIRKRPAAASFSSPPASSAAGSTETLSEPSSEPER